MTHGGREIEIKLSLSSAAAGRSLLRRAGFRVSRRRVFESNLIYDTRDRALRAAGAVLRVRQSGSVATLTYKGASTVLKHKSREELELRVAGAKSMAAVLERLGFERVFRYDKYRTEYRPASGRGMATLDETPIGAFVELEGAPRWIDRAARKLGFSESDYITASYGRLFLEWREGRSERPADMVFAS